jgi:ATP-dependent helicase/nuclease subunit A
LDRNFRSVPAVIETVNRVFSVLWENAYTPSETERSGHRGSVTLLEASLAAESGPTEAEVLAREIRRLINGGTMVYDRTVSSWKERKAGYGDCAVLIQSRTRLKEYEAALMTEGVPFRVVGGIGFYEEDEIQAVISVLFFLWNRDDRLALAAALRSPLFGLSEQDVLSLFTAGRDVFASLKLLQPAAWSLLHEWGRYAGTEPLAGLVHRIIVDTGAYIRFGRANPQAIFNLDKLLDTAREFDRRGYTTLQDFVEWVRNIRESEQREATADMNLPGFEGAVSIMTVHKAKGLEFPIVLLPGMNQPPRSVTHGPPVIVESDGGVRIAVKDKESPVYAELWEREREELRQEHQRLLYVAMTRARDHLVMIGTLTDDENAPVRQNTWLHFFRQAIPSSDAPGPRGLSVRISAHSDWEVRDAAGEIGEPASQKAERQLRAAEIDPGRVLDHLAPVPLSEALQWKKATDLLTGDAQWFLGRPVPQAPGAVSPLTRGSILHRCLEEHARTGAADVNSILKEFPDVQELEDGLRSRFQDEIAGVLRALTESEELAWIFRPQLSAYSELPFLFRSGGEVVSGIIDRIVIREEKGYLVDYKAIAVTDEESFQSLMNHYRPQVRIYCQAARELFRLESVEGYLLFLDGGRLALTVKV